MAVFAIADLHLSHVDEKSMDIFGRHWKGHWDKIQQAWRSRIGAEDLVLIPGDISWAMHMPEAQPDLDAIGRMPGQKLILRGNHDYWWSSLTQVRSALPEGMYALQNDCFAYRGQAVCGARGWHIDPAAAGYDEKILRREIGRLKLSLDHAKAHYPCAPMTVFFHYPPVYGAVCGEPWLALLKEYGVKHCYYGHIHSYGRNRAIVGEYLGICFHLVAADALNFTPVLVRC